MSAEPAVVPAAAPPLPAELLYGRLLATAVQHSLGGGPAHEGRLRRADGSVEPLPLARWLGPADAADAEILGSAQGPTLDIGCGPGRHVAALRAAGHPCLGIDLSPVAVSITRGRGADAMLGSVFEDVPRAGRWGTALLLDGNIGIGGAPAALLARARELLAPGGAVLVELEPPGAGTGRTRVRLEAPGVVSEWFAWAQVDADGIGDVCAPAGLEPAWTRSAGGRWFAALRRS
jgi:SAM-dependent methyltransferase